MYLSNRKTSWSVHNYGHSWQLVGNFWLHKTFLVNIETILPHNEALYQNFWTKCLLNEVFLMKENIIKSLITPSFQCNVHVASSMVTHTENNYHTLLHLCQQLYLLYMFSIFIVIRSSDPSKVSSSPRFSKRLPGKTCHTGWLLQGRQATYILLLGEHHLWVLWRNAFLSYSHTFFC